MMMISITVDLAFVHMYVLLILTCDWLIVLLILTCDWLIVWELIY